MQYTEYYREGEGSNLLPPSPRSHSHSHSPQPSPSALKSHFDPYPSHLPHALPGPSYTLGQVPSARPFPRLETPSTFVSDHSDHHDPHARSSPGPHSRSPPPNALPPPQRIGTPNSASNGTGYYAHQPHSPYDQGSRSMSAEPAPYHRQTTPGHHQHQHHQLQQLSHPRTPEPAIPNSPLHSPHPAVSSGAGSTLKVIQWTPQHGDEGTEVTIVLDSLAVSSPTFGPGSPAPFPRQSHPAPTRRFVVLFGQAVAPTKFTRSNSIDGTAPVGAEDHDAYVLINTFVPSRVAMGPIRERTMVIVQVVDDSQGVLEECIVGEWEPNSVAIQPVTPPRMQSLKRSGDDLESHRESPGLRSPNPSGSRSHHASPMLAHPSTFLSPTVSTQLLSPRPQGRARSTTPGVDGESKPQSASLRHPPIDAAIGVAQPDLLRTSQIPSGPIPSPFGGSVATYSNKAILKLQGDLNQMAMGWSNEEWTNRRRLIQFWRHQEGNVINATFRPIAQNDHVVNSIAISCIFRDEWNECFVTSVDTIYLLEALVGVRFSVEEKNRIRRNLEGFKPMTVSKSKVDSEPFFKLIMGFPNPKPRNIEKDVKVFPWKVLANALKKIIGKYSATYSAPVEGGGPALHIGGPSDEAGRPPSLQLNAGAQSSNDPYPLPYSPHVPTSIIHSPQLRSPRIPSPQHVSFPSRPHPESDPDLIHRRLSPSPNIISAPISPPYTSRSSSNPSAPSPYDYHLEPSPYGSSSLPPPSSAPPSTSHAYASGPPDAYPASANIFPAAEDYGVTTERLHAPALNHSRSYSEGPRRSAGPPPPMFEHSGYAYPNHGPPGGPEYYGWEGDDRRPSDGWKGGGFERRSASQDGYQPPNPSYHHTQERRLAANFVFAVSGAYHNLRYPQPYQHPYQQPSRQPYQQRYQQPYQRSSTQAQGFSRPPHQPYQQQAPYSSAPPLVSRPIIVRPAFALPQRPQSAFNYSPPITSAVSTLALPPVASTNALSVASPAVAGPSVVNSNVSISDSTSTGEFFSYLGLSQKSRSRARQALCDDLGISRDEIIKRENTWRLAQQTNSKSKPLTTPRPPAPPPRPPAPPCRPVPPKPLPPPEIAVPFPYLFFNNKAQRKAGRLQLRTEHDLSQEGILSEEDNWRQANQGLIADIKSKGLVPVSGATFGLSKESLMDPNRGRAFKELPLDIFYEIASNLDQADLLSLMRSSKQLRAILISPTANSLWLNARVLSLIPSEAEIPEWKVGDHERFSAALLCVGTRSARCTSCGVFEPHMATILVLRTSYCKIGLKMRSLLFEKKQEAERKAREVQREKVILARQLIDAKLTARRNAIEAALRVDGWTTTDFDSSWRLHKLVGLTDPLDNNINDIKNYLPTIKPLLVQYLVTKAADRERRRVEANQRLRKETLQRKHAELLSPLKGRAKNEFLSVARFNQLASVKQIWEAVEPPDELWEQHRDSIINEMEAEQRRLKLEAYKILSTAEHIVVNSGDDSTSATDELPPATDPFPEPFRIKMDATFAQHSNQLRCSCGSSENYHYPAIYDHYRYSAFGGRERPACGEPSVSPERVAATRLLLKLANVKDQRTTPALLDKVGNQFSCGSCEAAGSKDLATVAQDYDVMLDHVMTHLERVDGTLTWKVPKVIFESKKKAQERLALHRSKPS
ncbi:hypothetical protein P7C70_g1533, partial [Phenoliferia sp. Uapishka_3]